MFHPGWKMTVFTLLFAPLLYWLGTWQLEREQEKILLQQEYEAKQSAAPINVDSIDWNRTDLAFTTVQADGEFDNTHSFLLDNRVYEGKVGYELLSPFRTDSGLELLINRGWIAQGPTRTALPAIREITGRARIQGSIYVPLDETFLLGDEEEMGANPGPWVVQDIDIGRIATKLDAGLAPYTVRLSPGSAGLEQANWQAINMLPEKHRAYAVQWFAMLTALIGMFIYFGFKNSQAD